jgi:hypothetical protein
MTETLRTSVEQTTGILEEFMDCASRQCASSQRLRREAICRARTLQHCFEQYYLFFNYLNSGTTLPLYIYIYILVYVLLA